MSLLRCHSKTLHQQTAKSLQVKAIRTVPTLRSNNEECGAVVETEEEHAVSDKYPSLTTVQHLVEHIEVTLKNTVSLICLCNESTYQIIVVTHICVLLMAGCGSF